MAVGGLSAAGGGANGGQGAGGGAGARQQCAGPRGRGRARVVTRGGTSRVPARVVGDRGEAKALAGGAVDPVPEPGMADVEGEPAEQRLSRLRVVVEALQELGCLVGGFDDDPFVGRPAERLALDDLAGQPVADE